MEIWFIAVIAGAAAVGIVAVIIAASATQPPATTVPDGPEPENNTNIPNNSSGSPDPAPAPIIDGGGQGPLPVDDGVFNAIPDSNPPQIRDQSLRLEKVVEGLSAPTSMAFVDERNLIVLQKDDGRVMLVADGTLREEPLATFDVENASERGLLGVAVNDRDVFIYATVNEGEVRHRVYRFAWQDGSLEGKTLILDLPGTPGPNHDGGKMAVGSDGMLYVVIGDLNRDGALQNYRDGPAPDDTSVILKMDRDGRPAANIYATEGKAAAYYAYGVRNSFGLAFDPVTGTLWDTENGPDGYDEMNVVLPGFNSGWERVMGPMSRGSATEEVLVKFEGSHYADPAFSWQSSIGVTDMAFAGLPGDYENNIFAGDINNGRLYYLAVNGDRNGVVLEGDLADKVADGGEADAVTFGTGFGGITDLETGPDGSLFVLSYGGSIYRISPAQ
ncbi:MAG: PQQ-dependent sugar dehydrogenase [Nitrososphaera sp.]|uniref:PQQ-dependent sugar dehydrogenase n=1 Tax=Nitrososphaera sp. TaxID=1971748 RepID=UPI003D6FD84B